MLREFSVQLEDKVGALNRLTKTLARKKVQVQALTAKVNGEGSPTVGIVADEDAKLRETLDASQFSYEENEIASVTVSDDPQDLAKLTELLADSMIDVKAVYILAKVGTTVQYGFVADNIRKVNHILNEQTVQEFQEV